MTSPAFFKRIAQRAEVRNLSYIELLLIVVFSTLLIFSFANEKLATSQKLIDDQMDKLDAAAADARKHQQDLQEKKTAIARLEALAAPGPLSILRNVTSLEQDKKRLLGDVVALKAERDRLQQRLAKIADAETGRATLEREAGLLRGQLKELENRVKYIDRQQKTADARKGKENLFGRPPCWIDDDGKIVKTFDIFITDQGYRIVGAWPSAFDGKARSRPEIVAMSGKSFNVAEFKRLAGALDAVGRKAGCTYYARPRREATRLSLDAYDDRKELVSQYFYPF